MQLPTSPDLLREQLLNPWSVPRSPGRSVVDMQVAAYTKAESGDRVRFGESLADLLRDWKSLVEETGEALQDALELALRTRAEQTKAPLRDIVMNRSLTARVGGYSDLHGRALEALEAVRGLNPLACWETEVKYRDYAPLAFAFVRDRAPDCIPSILHEVARLGFLRDALRTIVAKEDGLNRLEICAKWVKDLRDRTVLGKFLDALPRLGLTATQEDSLYRALGSLGQPVRVMVHLEKELNPLVSERLRNVGFEVLHPDRSWQARPGDWALVSSGFDHPETLGARTRVFKVFDENDPPERSKEHEAIIIPDVRLSPEEKEEVIRDGMLSALHAHWLAQGRQERPIISDTTLEAGSPSGETEPAMAALTGGRR